MNKNLIALIASASITVVNAASSATTQISYERTTIPYLSAIVPKEDGTYKGITSILSVGTRIVKDANGICWKENSKLDRMEEYEYQGFVLQMPHTSGFTQQIACD